jgi:hypothetical protein
MAWTTPATAVAGDTLTAAFWNLHVRDNLNWIARAGITGWSSFTPTWGSDGTAPAIGNGTLTGAYQQIGTLIVARFRMILGSTSTVGTGNYNWLLPVSAVNIGTITAIGVAYINDATAGVFHAAIQFNSTTAIKLRAAADQITLVSATSPMVPASGDEYAGTYVYASAS